MAPELVPAPVKPAAKPTALSRAYVTFLAGSEDNVKGVVGLAKGLQRAKSAYPLVVAVLSDVPAEHRRILEEQGCVVREIEPVYPPHNQTLYSLSAYVINYSKLRIWEFVGYSKITYLDANMQVLDNIDHLFDLANGKFYAVMDCSCDRRWEHAPQFQNGQRRQCPHRVQWRDAMGLRPAPYFDAAMFVIEPNLATYKDLLSTLKTTPPLPLGHQEFLNTYFSNIVEPLSLDYNLNLTILQNHREKVKLEEVKVVHFCAALWKCTDDMRGGDIQMLVEEWKDFIDNYIKNMLGVKFWDFMIKENQNMLVKKCWDLLFNRDMKMDVGDMKMLVQNVWAFMNGEGIEGLLQSEDMTMLVDKVRDLMHKADMNMLVKKWWDINQDDVAGEIEGEGEADAEESEGVQFIAAQYDMTPPAA